MVGKKPLVLMIVTHDTKEFEGRFLRTCLEEAGCEIVHLDPSVRRTVGSPEIPPEEVAEAAGWSIERVRALGHEGKCQAVMIEGAIRVALHHHEAQPFSGIISIGGSMGTTLGTAVMKAFPYGLPKLMVSTMASGFTAPFVGAKDIIMSNAVTDVSGINSISRDVYRNAALAIAGMAKGYDPAAQREDRPLVLMTTLGTTEASVRRVREALQDDGNEVMVFHCAGGGGTLDAIVEGRDVALVLDLSATEIVDHLHGGLTDGGPERAMAALRKGIPTILAPGNADFIIGGPLAEAKKRFPGTRYHMHNAALTAVRTQMQELRNLADHYAKMVIEAKGPVRFFVPLGGFSSHDSPEGHLHDINVPGPFAEYLRKVIPSAIPVEAVDAHFNDEVFADRIILAARDYLKIGVHA